MKAVTFKVLVGTTASLLSGLVMAGLTTPLGASTQLPILEGGVVTIGIAALVAGIRIIKRNNKR